MGIITKELLTIEDFESLKPGDTVACEFYRNVHDGMKVYRFKTFEIYLNRFDTKEIILKKKWNIYFNYEAFVNKEVWSILKSAVLITVE